MCKYGNQCIHDVCHYPGATHLNINAGATLNCNGNVLAVSDTYTNAGSLQGATTTAVLEMDLYRCPKTWLWAM